MHLKSLDHHKITRTYSYKIVFFQKSYIPLYILCCYARYPPKQMRDFVSMLRKDVFQSLFVLVNICKAFNMCIRFMINEISEKLIFFTFSDLP